jgi:hypothetical protein
VHEEHFPDDKDNPYRIILEKFNETRTIKIKGKNVDNLDLEKVGNLIQQTIEESSKVNSSRLVKILKKALP